jgi:L-lactate dehydrogenase (cytochrome)
MYARRGEVQAAQRGLPPRNIPFIQSTVSVCPLAEVAGQASKPIWFQLYVLKDRGFMRDVMRRARDWAPPRWCSRSTCRCRATATATPTAA